MSIQADSNAVRHLPDKWGAVLVGLVPFAGIALMVLLFMLVSKAFQSNQQLLNLSRNILANIIIFWYLGVFIIGWIKGFPRWWYPYSLSLILISFFMQHASTPGLWLFGLVPENQVWGLRAWLPLGCAIFLALLLTRSFKPFIEMSKSIWIDPSRLAFAVYSLLPFLYVVMYDEVKDNYQLPFLIISLVILSLGTILYMRAKNNWQRLSSLYGSAIITALLNSIALMFYWDGRLEPWMSSPLSWQDQVSGSLMLLVFVSLFILGPALSIEFIRIWKNYKPINPTMAGS